MADYIFELIIDELDNRGLFLEKAGEKEFTPAIFQKFDECWGVQDSVYERKIFDFWKDSFLPMLLQKYNISEENCKVRYQGPNEMHVFFKQESYKNIFEAVGEPIKRIEESELYSRLDENSKKKCSMETENSVIEFYTDKYIPEKKEELEKFQTELKEIETTLNEEKGKSEELNKELEKIKTKIDKEQKEIKEKENSLLQMLDTVYRDFSSEMNELNSKKFTEKKYDELLKEVKKTFDISSIRKKIVNNLPCENKGILLSIFTDTSLSDCVMTAINCALVRGKEHGFLKKNKWFEYIFDSSKFINTLNESINKTIKDKKAELRSNLNLQPPFNKNLDLLKIDLKRKNNEISKCDKQIKEYEKKQKECNTQINKLNKSLISKQNKVEALNAR